jgi:hypothetical protein
MTVAAMPIDRAMLDRRLLGAGLLADGDAATWSTWLTVLRAAFGIELSDDELELFHAIAGNRKPPRRRVRQLWALVGRRGGKSRIAAMVAVYVAIFVPHRVAAGERPMVLVVAPSQDQAGVCLGYVLGFLRESAVLRREIDSVTRSEVRLRNGVSIAVHACSFRSIRGKTLLAAIFDEVAYWRSEDSAQPDHEVFSAVLPSLVTTGGLLVGISTTYRRAGLLHAKFRDHYGQDSDDVLVVKGSTLQFNRTLDPAAVDAMKLADPAAAASEWMGEFRDDLSSFLDDQMIEDAIDRDRPLELPPKPGVIYRAFCDASGGAAGGDAYAVCVGHKEGDRFIVDVVRATRPGVGFNPRLVTEEYAQLLRDYHVGTVVGDHYAAEWVVDAWRAAKPSIHYMPCDIPKSQVYLEALPWFSRGLISLPDRAFAPRA